MLNATDKEIPVLLNTKYIYMYYLDRQALFVLMIQIVISPRDWSKFENAN